MDWYLDEGDREGATILRREFVDYLSRHSDGGPAIDLAALTFAELVNNAVEHGMGPVWVSVDWTGPHPFLSVNDLGESFELVSVAMPDPTAVRGRGLAIAADTAARLEIEAKAGGGSRVEAELPITRRSEKDLDPPRRTRNVLPDISEAGVDGFGREAFLRSLVVQLAQGVERLEGPMAAESAVAQVGTDVGGQMEAEFRSTFPTVSDQMTPEQIGDCYVRLKSAIGGDFYVIEQTDDRIVLGNRQCPFGDAVLRAPALCRMTSSVFGGIAARNFGEATVVLEERIAVGDPECRVTVYLGNHEEIPHGHRYLAPTEP